MIDSTITMSLEEYEKIKDQIKTIESLDSAGVFVEYYEGWSGQCREVKIVSRCDFEIEALEYAKLKISELEKEINTPRVIEYQKVGKLEALKILLGLS